MRSAAPTPRKKLPPSAKRNAEERDAAFRADCRAADAAGLSYGKYMLLKNKKPSGVTSTGEPAKG